MDSISIDNMEIIKSQVSTIESKDKIIKDQEAAIEDKQIDKEIAENEKQYVRLCEDISDL
eukprot:scaffold389677_cov47-Prasinocladus_malaysianus.AAC.1